MIQMHKERELVRQKREEEKEKLSKLHLASSVSEFDHVLVSIDEDPCLSNSKKKTNKLSLLKEQVKIRKKLLKQNVKVVFSSHGKQRPLSTTSIRAY